MQAERVQWHSGVESLAAGKTASENCAFGDSRRAGLLEPVGHSGWGVAGFCGRLLFQIVKGLDQPLSTGVVVHARSADVLQEFATQC